MGIPARFESVPPAGDPAGAPSNPPGSPPPRAPGINRPDRPYLVVTTESAEVLRQEERPGPLEGVIGALVEDYREGLAVAEEIDSDPRAFAARWDDAAVWRDGRLVALVRARPGADPEVIRFDAGVVAGGPAPPRAATGSSS